MGMRLRRERSHQFVSKMFLACANREAQEERKKRDIEYSPMHQFLGTLKMLVLFFSFCVFPSRFCSMGGLSSVNFPSGLVEFTNRKSLPKCTPLKTNMSPKKGLF